MAGDLEGTSYAEVDLEYVWQRLQICEPRTQSSVEDPIHENPIAVPVVRHPRSDRQQRLMIENNVVSIEVLELTGLVEIKLTGGDGSQRLVGSRSQEQNEIASSI